MFVRRLVASILSALVCMLFASTTVSAQRSKTKPPPPPPPIVTPQTLCPGVCSVSVAPKGHTDVLRGANGGGSFTFQVTNTGDQSDSWGMTCAATGVVTCGSVNPTGVSLGPSGERDVIVSYNTGNPGNGTIKLKASSGWSKDSATLTVPVGKTVAVTPKNLPPISVAPSTTLTLRFDVKNNAQVSDNYSLTCSVTGSEICQSVTPSTLGLAAGQHDSVTLTYISGASGSGTVQIKAQSTIYGANVTDSSSITVWNGGGPTPTVSLAPYSGARHNAGEFDMTASHATPAYWSGGNPQTLELSYNASTVSPTPVVSVDVTPTQAPCPSTYGIQVQIVGGALLTLLNGGNVAYFAASSCTKTRMIAGLDARANGLTTGWYDVDVIITSVFTGGSSSQSTRSRLLVDDESKGSFGAGWSLGIPRIYVKPGSYSVLIAEGDGSLSFFQRDSANAPFISPAGDPSTLVWMTDSTYRRTNLDGSYVNFRTDGRTSTAVMPFNATTTLTLTWTDTLLASIRDVIGKTTNLSYANGKLASSTDPAGRTTLYSVVDTLLRKITEPNGDSTTYSYDSLKRLARVTDNAGGSTDVSYDQLSQLATLTGPSFQDYAGNSVRQAVIYQSPDRHAWQPAIAGTTAAVPKHNPGDSLLTGNITDPLGAITQYTVDRFGLQLKITDPVGQVTQISRDTLGQPTTVIEPNGHTTNFTYTGYLVTRESDAWAGTNIYYDYNAANMLITIRGDVVRSDIYYFPAYNGGPLNGPVDSVYSANTGSYSAAIGGRLVARHRVNKWGQDSVVTDGQGHSTTTVYADTAHFGSVVQTIDQLGRVVAKYAYDSAGRVDSSWTLAQGAYAPTSQTYDALNRRTTVKDALGHVIQYGYVTQGMNRVIDAKGQVYKFDLNALGMIVAQHDLADTTKADSLKYDVGGQVRTVRTRRGDAVSMSYDSLSHLVARTGLDFVPDSFRYDPQGRWMVATNANAYDSLNFDLRGRLTNVVERLTGATTYSMTYTYDAQDRVIARSAPTKGTRVTYTYDATKGVITKFCAAAGCAQPQQYDADNIPHVIAYTDTLLNAAWSRADTVDARHLETSNGFVNNTGTPISLSAFQRGWTYDSVGRVTFEQSSGAGPQWWYDANGELLGSCFLTNSPPPYTNVCYDEYGVNRHFVSGTPGNAYAYDAAGNRIDSLASAVVGPGNRTTSFRGYNLTYDANGSVITKYGTSSQWGTDSSTYTWDALGRLATVTLWPAGGAHTTASFAYDALGRRVSKTVNGVTQWYAHEGDQVVMILDSLGQRLKLELGWAPGTDNLAFARGQSWTGVALTTPQNATVRGVVSPTPGAPIRKQYDWSASATWGNPAPDTGTIFPFKMGGAEFDQEIKLSYMRARYYDPQLGRFLSEDPAGISGGLNFYEYAGNDPTNSRDPSGLYRSCMEYGTIYYWHYADGHDEIIGVVVDHVDCTDVDAGGGPPQGPGRGGQGQGPTKPSKPQKPAKCPATVAKLSAALENLWHRSDDNNHKEAAAWIFETPSGQLTLRNVQRLGGSQSIPVGQIPKGAKGRAHVHPNYGIDPATGGTWIQRFSPQDIHLSDSLNYTSIVVSRDSFFYHQPHGTIQACARP